MSRQRDEVENGPCRFVIRVTAVELKNINILYYISSSMLSTVSVVPSSVLGISYPSLSVLDDVGVAAPELLVVYEAG
jgi:hypothetical protein